MRIYSFRGGVHPRENKEPTREKPLRPFLPKEDLVFPLGQHIGKPAVPVVKRGDEVLAGQLIAKADGFVSANIYSSCSGKVKAIERRPVGAGTMADCIVIDNDGAFTPVPGMGEKTDWQTLSKEQILAKIQEAGIVGMGGAGFPTHVKLAPKNPEDIKYFIANGAECEPGITCDDRLMREYPEQIVEGMKIVLKLFPNASGVIAVEKNKPEAIAALQKAASGDNRLSMLTLKVKYPQGGERNLVHAVTGGYMGSGELPAALGCVVDNVSTIAAIYRAVCENTPLIERGVTVTGEPAGNEGNFMVRLGTTVKELLEEGAGGVSEDAKKIIMGGPMMGTALSTLDVPIVKTSNALTLMMEDPVEEAEAMQTNCIHCGRCTRVCPLGLIPQAMAEAAQRKDYDRYIRLHGLDCISCGCCTYTCPAKRPLTLTFKEAKPLAMAWSKALQAEKEAAAAKAKAADGKEEKK